MNWLRVRAALGECHFLKVFLNLLLSLPPFLFIQPISIFLYMWIIHVQFSNWGLVPSRDCKINHTGYKIIGKRDKRWKEDKEEKRRAEGMKG